MTVPSSTSAGGGGGHNVMVSMAKAVLIMLMVIGHSGLLGTLYDFTHLFRMPAFFFISGYLFRPAYLDDALLFLRRKLRSYYVPFVKWSLLFLVLRGVFYRMGIYAEEFELWDYVKRALQIVRLSQTEPLLHAYWFLRDLLISSLLAYAAFRVAGVRRSVSRAAWVALVFVVASTAYSFSPVEVPYITSATLLAAAFFSAGYLFRNYRRPWLEGRWTGVACLTIIAVAAQFLHWNIEVKHWAIPAYFVIALVGAVGVMDIVAFIPQRLRPMFDYVGSRTLYILTFHIVCFKLLDYLSVNLGWLPESQLPVIAVRDVEGDFFWVAYSLVGILVPLGLWEITHRLPSLKKIWLNRKT